MLHHLDKYADLDASGQLAASDHRCGQTPAIKEPVLPDRKPSAENSPTANPTIAARCLRIALTDWGSSARLGTVAAPQSAS
ncbi:hypothetical protein QA646_30470 (plasmid) [Rhizobium sp. CB3090]|uniref:hypothetical protein n=1 Tax=Rhizobium sp. CB3090 TaxID=3039156 RepID=UPI0024B181B2|nr:hypothetical protein [Rhizobium sp. CB3090]WFU13307.1 hypothetical protein QA646_30470 [Rhizobium sp. CB3090]